MRNGSTSADPTALQDTYPPGRQRGINQPFLPAPETRWLIAKRNLLQLRIPAVQHERCVGFLMQVNLHINDILFSQMSPFLLFLFPFVIVNLPANTADKRYVPVYAFLLRPSQGGISLSISTTCEPYRFLLFQDVVYVSSVCGELQLLFSGFLQFVKYDKEWKLFFVT